MKQLFGIKSNDGHHLAKFFEKKEDAKQERNELNGGTPKELATKDKKVKYTLTYGPDHYRISSR